MSGATTIAAVSPCPPERWTAESTAESTAAHASLTAQGASVVRTPCAARAADNAQTPCSATPSPACADAPPTVRAVAVVLTLNVRPPAERALGPTHATTPASASASLIATASSAEPTRSAGLPAAPAQTPRRAHPGAATASRFATDETAASTLSAACPAEAVARRRRVGRAEAAAACPTARGGTAASTLCAARAAARVAARSFATECSSVPPPADPECASLATAPRAGTRSRRGPDHSAASMASLLVPRAMAPLAWARPCTGPAACAVSTHQRRVSPATDPPAAFRIAPSIGQGANAASVAWSSA